MASRRAPLVAAAATLVLAAAPRPAGGQDVSKLPPGTLLRVNGRCAVCVAQTGNLVRMHADTLWLRMQSREQPITRAVIITLEMRLERDRVAGGARGAVIGLLIGAAFCGFLGAAGGASDPSGEGYGAAVGAVLGALVCGGAGALIGAVAGVAGGGEEWVPVPLPPPA